MTLSVQGTALLVQPDVLLVLADWQRPDFLCELPEPLFLPQGPGPRAAQNACLVAVVGRRGLRRLDCRHGRGPHSGRADLSVRQARVGKRGRTGRRGDGEGMPQHRRRNLPLSPLPLSPSFSFACRPYLAVGWLWYLIMLLPVIGVLQVGIGNAADRFTYLPQIGLAVALVWGGFDICRAWPRRGRLTPARRHWSSWRSSASLPGRRRIFGTTALPSGAMPSIALHGKLAGPQ